MRTTAIVIGTIGYLQARLAVVLEESVVRRTGTLNATVHVGAQVGAATIVLSALVYVLAGLVVLGQLVAGVTLTVEAAKCIDTAENYKNWFLCCLQFFG